MRLFDLFEDIKGNINHNIEYDTLYHLTDSHGFSFSIDSNSLKSLRNYYVSTTYDKNMNSFVGGNHYDFKFILNGKKLAKNYGAFEFDYHFNYSDGSRSSANEREIGINTKSIEPLNEYVTGVILLFDIFSEKCVKWLLSDNNKHQSFMDAEKAQAPPAIQTLKTIALRWKKPIYVGIEQRQLNKQEIEFLKKLFKLNSSGKNYKEALLALVNQYNIKDFDDEVLDSTFLNRRNKKDEITDMFNNFYRTHKVKDISETDVQKLVVDAMNMLNLNNNIQNTIIHCAKQYGMFGSHIPPVEWAIVFKDIVRGDIDGAIDSLEFCGKRNKRDNTWASKYHDDDEYSYYHPGTSF